MKVFYNIDEFPDGIFTVVSVGTFDGVHTGHQAIINRMMMLAKSHNLASLILTFDPHPRYALKKDENKLKLLTTTAEKLALLSCSGIDYVLVINFTAEFSRIPYDKFIRKYLWEALHAKYVVIGFDHRFGENRAGNHQLLIDSKARYDFDVVEIKALNDDGSAISSTKIRALIENRKIEQANLLLNYDYYLSGKVVRGTQKGKQLGFPTANISVNDSHKLIPANGVYAVKIEVDDHWYYGMCNIGYKPTFQELPLTIEVYIFDFDKNIYDKNIRVAFVNFIREEMKFDSSELLIAQVKEDEKTIRKKFNV